MPRENSTVPVYYIKNDHRGINEFKNSDKYIQFKEEYIYNIKSTIEFYLTHATDHNQKISVEDGLNKFSDRLFGQNPEPSEQLHILFQGKKAMEEIAEALIPEEGDPPFSPDEITEKLIAIYNLAGKDLLSQEVGCLVCASGTVRNLDDTAQILKKGDLFNNVLIQRRNLFWETLSKYVFITHRSEINQRVGGQNHETNLLNAFINAFSEEWGFPLVTELYVNKTIVTEKDKENINLELTDVVTQDNITDRLATEYLKKIKDNIIFNDDGTIQLSSANIAIEKLEKHYGTHDINSVFSVNENNQLLSITADPTAIKVAINHFITKEIENKKTPVNMFPLTWSTGTLIGDDNKGKTLWYSGDLFWSELIDEYGDKTIMLPTAQQLGENYINKVGYSQLLQIIRQNNSAESSAIFLKVKPIRFEMINKDQLPLFFAQLDTNGGINNAISYANNNKEWFNNLVKKYKYNPLTSLAITRLNRDQLVELSPEDILLQGLSLLQARQFLFMLDPEGSTTRAIDYVTKHKTWFKALVDKMSSNPLLPVLLDRLTYQELTALSPDNMILYHLSPIQINNFLANMDPTNSVDRAIAYTIKHKAWFNDQKKKIGNNPLVPLLLQRLDSEQLMKITPDNILQQLSTQQVEDFLSKLDRDNSSMTKALEYVTRHERWFDILLSNLPDNPLVSLLLARLTPEELVNLVPDIVLQSMSILQAKQFFAQLDHANERSITQALAYTSRYPVWFKELVNRTKSNPLIPLLIRLTSEELANLDPNIALQGLSINESKTFFLKLDPNPSNSMTNTLAYVNKHKQWFSALVEKNLKNSLAELLLAYLTPRQLMTIEPNIVLQNLSAIQAKQFFSRLYHNDESMANALDYAIQYKQWFSDLVKKNKENPLIEQLVLQEPQDLMVLKPDIVLRGLSEKQAKKFFARLNNLPKNDDTGAEAYANHHRPWFSALVTRLNANPLAALLLETLSPEELENRLPNNIAFEGLSASQAQGFFKKLAKNGRNTEIALNYANQHSDWFNALVKRIAINPLTNLAIRHYSSRWLGEMKPSDLSLKGANISQISRFLAKLDEPTDHEITKAIDYITRNNEWFERIVEISGENPLFEMVDQQYRMTPEEFAQLSSKSLVLSKINEKQARTFFTTLVDPFTRDLTRMNTYVTENKEWFAALIDRNGENPLISLIIQYYSPSQLIDMDPDTHIALQGLSASQAGEFLIALDRENNDTSNAQAYIIRHQQWFTALVNKLGANPVVPLLTDLNSYQLANIDPNIILRGLSAEQAQEFFSKLVSGRSTRVTLAMTFAQTNKAWFIELVRRTGINPLTPLLLTHLSSEQLVKSPPEIALLDLSKNQIHDFLTHMAAEDAASYIENNSKWFNQQGWKTPELLIPSDNNEPLGKAAPLDISPVNSWQKPVVNWRQDGGKSRFTGQIIVQLENDPSVCGAAAQLAGKHPETSVIVQLDIEGNYHVVFGDLNDLTANLRWQLVGHGRDGQNELNHQTFGGRTPQKLAEQLSKFSTHSEINILPKHISLVGCSLADYDPAGSYLHRFISSLTQQGIHPSSIGAYATQLKVNQQGQKRLTETGEKVILTQSEGQWISAQQPGKVDNTESRHQLLASLGQAQRFESSMTKLYRHNGLSGSDWLPMLHTLKKENAQPRYYSLTLMHKKSVIPSPHKRTVTTDDPNIIDFIHQYNQRLSKSFGRVQSETEGIHGLNTAFIIQAWFMQRARDTAAEEPLPKNLKTALQVHTYANITQMTLGALDDSAKFLQLSRELAQVNSAPSAMFKTFSHFSAGAGIGLNILNIGLSSYELAHAQSEAQRALYGTQLAFGLANLGVSVTSLGASVVGAAGVSSFAGALAVPLAGLGIGITALVMSTQVHINKTKMVGRYFATLDNGYAKGGYQKIAVKTSDTTKHQVWENRPGIAIKKIDLRQQQLTYGDSFIYKTYINGIGSGYDNIITMALPSPNKKIAPINIREGIDYSSPTASFVPDKETPLVLPSTPEYYIDYNYETFPGVTLRYDSGFEVLRRLEKNYRHSNNNFSFDFYCFPSEYAISELKFQYTHTPVQLILDDNDRTIIMPTLSNEAKGKMSYSLTGGNARYHISLQEAKSLTLKSGSSNTDWELDARSLANVSQPSFDSQRRLNLGQLKINFTTDFKGIVRLINQEGSFLINIPRQQIMRLNADVSRFKNWTSLHNYLKQISNTDFHKQPFIPVENYLTPKGERVGRAFYETAKDRFIYTNRSNMETFLRDGQLAKVENNIAWLYRNNSVWQVNIMSGEVLQEYRPLNFEPDAAPSKSTFINDDNGRQFFVVEYQKKSGPLCYVWQLSQWTMTLVSITGEEQDIPDIMSSRQPSAAQFSQVSSVIATQGEVIHRLARRQGHNYHSWLKKSADASGYTPILQLNLATIAPEDIQPIPVKIDDKISYYFFSPRQQDLYFQPNNGLAEMTHQSHKAHKIGSNIQTLFTMQNQLMAKRQDGTLWLADTQGNLLLAGVSGNWLKKNRNKVIEHLRTLVTKSEKLPSLRLEGLSDSQGKSILAWYDINADKIILSGTGITANHTLHYRGLSSDGKQAWLYNSENGLLYRQPQKPNTQLAFNQRGQSRTTRLPAETWTSGRYLSVVSTGEHLRLTTREGAVLLLPKAAGPQDRPQLIAWLAGKQTEAQLTTAIEALRSQAIPAPFIRLLKTQGKQTPTWYLTEQKTFLRAQGLNGANELHWLGLAAGQTKAYIHDQTTGDLWLADASQSIASERYRFIFLQQDQQDGTSELVLQFAPSNLNRDRILPKLKDAHKVIVAGITEGDRYVFDDSLLEHYQQITLEELGKKSIIRLPDTLHHLSLRSSGKDLILHHRASNTRIYIVNAEQVTESPDGMQIQFGDRPAVTVNHLVKEMHKHRVQIPGVRPSAGASMEMELKISPTDHALEYYSSPSEKTANHKLNQHQSIRVTAQSASDTARLRESMSALGLNSHQHSGMVRNNRISKNRQQQLQLPINHEF